MDDRAVVDNDGYVTIISRDDVITIDNCRLGTDELEAAITTVDGVIEVIAVAESVAGETALRVFATLEQE